MMNALLLAATLFGSTLVEHGFRTPCVESILDAPSILDDASKREAEERCTAPRPFFAFVGLAPNPGALSKSITVNGITATASVWCQGGSATATEWTCDAQTLTAAGSGGSFAQGSPLGSGTAVDGVGTRRYTGGTFNPGANDVVVEAVAVVSSGATAAILSTRTAGGQGFELFANNTNAIRAYVGGATTNATVISNTTTLDHWIHILLIIDRSGSGQLYINGLASGAAVDVSGVGTITASSLALLARADTGGSIYADRVAHVAAWAHSNVGSHLQAQFARDRAAAAFGITPGFTSATSRASLAVVEIGGVLHKVASHWMRADSDGYFSESTTTNLALRSQDLSATWAKNDAGDTIGGSVVDPQEATSTVSGIIGDSTDGNHGVSQAITVTATAYSFSAYFQAGTQSWARLLNATTGSSLYCNLSGSGSLGATASTIKTWIDRLGTTNWYRCGFSFTGTAAAHTFHLRVAQGDGDDSVAGNGSSVQLYAWGAQVEALPIMSSYVVTAGVTAGRTADTLRYNVTEFDIDSRGVSLVVDINRGVLTASSVSGLLRLSDGASNNDRVNLLLTTTGTAARTLVTAASVGQADFSGTTNTGTGALFTIAAFAKTNDVRMFVNGTQEGTPDVSATMPDDLDTVDIDADYSAHISRASLFLGEVRR
jgi:hypothetical protein